jgi:hypothetical protein
MHHAGNRAPEGLSGEDEDARASRHSRQSQTGNVAQVRSGTSSTSWRVADIPR